jgi:hypothetical protein
MKYVFSALVAVGVLIVLAAPATGDWDPIRDPNTGEIINHKMHFPQLPDPNGWDVKFGPVAIGEIKALADDWVCSQTGPVRDVHFWFSSKGDALSPQTGMIQNIHVGIWSNDPGIAGQLPSRPKDLLWWGDAEKGDFGHIAVRGPSSGVQGWYDPDLPFDPGANPIPNDHNKYWQVNITDILDPFIQTRGEVYWLELYMVTRPIGTQPPIEVGWKTADTSKYPGQFAGRHFMDDAFYGHVVPTSAIPLVEWIGPLEDPTGPVPRSLDLAFVITPEPGTVVMLIGAGLIGLVAYARRQKQR